MNVLQKERIKTTFKYTWPLYLVSALIVGLLMGFIFNATHQTPGYKVLTIFVSGRVNDEKALRDDILKKYEEKGMQSISYIEADPSDGQYYSKLTIPGYSNADILIIPSSYLTHFKISSGAIELSNEMIEAYYQGYTLYQEDSVNYGVKIDKTKVEKYMSLPNEECYMFLNANSENIGEYSKKQIKEHDVALNVVKDWGM